MRGRIKAFTKGGWGVIASSDDNNDVHFYAAEALRLGLGPGDEGSEVEYDLFEDERGTHARLVALSTPRADRPRNCFIVMPFGRTPEEIRWFEGWYTHVIEIAVTDSGYIPILAANQDAPSAINDEIRAHLTFDPMVIIDLGGRLPTDPPNPNVMYELGIRHALNLPLVMMGWAGQALPFDISNQRVLMERRELIDIGINRERLARFIREAENGNYYRPMDAVGRHASLRLAEERLDPNSVLASLVKEVRSLRTEVNPSRSKAVTIKGPTIGGLFNRKHKARLQRLFTERGGLSTDWHDLLKLPLDSDIRRFFHSRKATAWDVLISQTVELLTEGHTVDKAVAIAVEKIQLQESTTTAEDSLDVQQSTLDHEKLQLLSDAIRNRMQVRAEYGSHQRHICPHKIGSRRGKYYCLCFQFGGGTSKGEIGAAVTPGWRCFPLEDLVILDVTADEWHSGPQNSYAENCIENVIVQVDEGPSNAGDPEPSERERDIG